MNTDMIKSGVRWVLTLISGSILGWLTARNLLTAEQLAQVGSFLTSEATVSLIVGLATLIWGLLAHTTNAKVRSAADLPMVDRVVMQPTEAGKKVAENVGSTPKATVTIGEPK